MTPNASPLSEPEGEETALALRLTIALDRAYNAVLERTWAHMAEFGLAGTEFAILELLFHRGALPLGDIGKKVMLTSGGLTYAIDKLEERGVVTRRRDASDRRVVFAELTRAGRELMARVVPLHAEFIRELTAGLDADEKQEATRLLGALERSARRDPW